MNKKEKRYFDYQSMISLYLTYTNDALTTGHSISGQNKDARYMYTPANSCFSLRDNILGCLLQTHSYVK